jgi:NhaP-type Na+/H+ and K+/H+ antiporter
MTAVCQSGAAEICADSFTLLMVYSPGLVVGNHRIPVVTSGFLYDNGLCWLAALVV